MLTENSPVKLKSPTLKIGHLVPTTNALVSAVLSKGPGASLFSASDSYGYEQSFQKSKSVIAKWQNFSFASAPKVQNEQIVYVLRVSQKLINSHNVAIRPSIAESTSPDAESFAKSHRLYGALVLAKEIVHEQMGHIMSALHIKRHDDPDDPELSRISFAITTRESVDLVLKRDSALQDAFIKRLPPTALEHFTIDYHFE